MPFILVLPFIVIGIVVAISKKTAEQNRRAEAQRRAAQMQAEQTASEGQASYVPVRPSVQVPPVRKATPAPNMPQAAQKTYQSSISKAPDQMHAGHDFCALRPDTTKGKSHPDHDNCSLRPEDSDAVDTLHASKDSAVQKSSGFDLSFTQDQILNGVIFSEILGKPKALQ